MTLEDKKILRHVRFWRVLPFLGLATGAILGGSIAYVTVGSTTSLIIATALLIIAVVGVYKAVTLSNITLEERVRYYVRKEKLEGPDIALKLLSHPNRTWGSSTVLHELREQRFGVRSRMEDEVQILEVSDNPIPDEDLRLDFNQFKSSLVPFGVVKYDVYKLEERDDRV